MREMGVAYITMETTKTQWAGGGGGGVVLTKASYALIIKCSLC